METFTGAALRSNLGSTQWNRFFVLMSSAIALKEGCPPVSGTPNHRSEMVEELKDLSRELEVRRIFVALGFAAYQVGKPVMKEDTEYRKRELEGADMFLLALDPRDKSLAIYAYKARQLQEATAKYLEFERERPELQAVLVSVDRIEELRSAYPNYYLDTNSFLEELRELTGGTEEN
jgi:hypothetical protein